MAARKIYQGQLRTLQDELTQMGNLCTQAVQLAIQAVVTGDRALAARTTDTDDIIDKKEWDIESLCLKLLLQQQPVASDMRRITSALKVISDLKRIGDQSEDIAEISRYVVIQDGSAASDIHTMAGEVVEMVNESINAFIGENLDLAQQVISWDDKVDDWFVCIKNDLITAIADDNTKGEYCLETLMVAKYLEKIGDHATNVARWVEYYILGYHPEKTEAGSGPDET